MVDPKSEKCALTWAFTPGHEGGGFPKLMNRGFDQGKCSWIGRGIRGYATPSTRTQLAKAQVSGDRPTATISEGGKRADDESEATRTKSADRCSCVVKRLCLSWSDTKETGHSSEGELLLGHGLRRCWRSRERHSA